MMTEQLQPLKESYYEYVGKVPQGLTTIMSLLQQQQYEEVFRSLANLAEGVEALFLIEQAFIEQGYTTNSRLQEAVSIMKEIVEAITQQAFGQLEDLVKKLHTAFESATEWELAK